MTGLELLVLLGLGGLVPIAGVLLVRRSYRRTWQQELVAYVLRFPRGLDPAAVVAFLGGLAGLVAPRHQRPFVVRAVVFETSATPAGIQHHLVVPRSLAHVVLSALRAALPGVSVRPDEDYQVARPALAAELGISDHHRSLVSDRAAAISNAILASLYPLDAGEQLVVQWSLSPLGPVPVAAATAEQSVAGGVWDLLRGQTSDRTIDPEVVKAARTKQLAPLFAATIRVSVVADRLRARSLLLRVLAAFHTANAPGVHLYRLSRSNNRVARGLSERRLPLASWPCTLRARSDRWPCRWRIVCATCMSSGRPVRASRRCWSGSSPRTWRPGAAWSSSSPRATWWPTCWIASRSRAWMTSSCSTRWTTNPPA